MVQQFHPPRHRFRQKFFGCFATGVVAAATRYMPITSHYNHIFDEPQVQMAVHWPGVLRNLRVWALPGANAAVIVLRINAGAIATTLTVTIPAGGPEAEFTDLVNSDAVVAGDLVNWRITGGPGFPTVYRAGCDFYPSGVEGGITLGIYPPRNVPQKMASISFGAALVANQTRWFAFKSMVDAGTVEARAQMAMHSPGILRNLRVYISTAAANDATFTLKVNGNPTALTVTYPGGGAIGVYSDLVNAVRVAEGNLVCWEATAGAAAPSISRIETDFYPDEGEDRTKEQMFYPPRTVRQKFNAARPSGSVPAAGTQYVPIEGRLAGLGVAHVQMTMQHPGTIRGLRVYAQPGPNDATVTLNVNGVNTALTTTITGGAAEGLFTDLVNVVSVDEGEPVCWELITPPAGGVTLYRFECVFTPSR